MNVQTKSYQGIYAEIDQTSDSKLTLLHFIWLTRHFAQLYIVIYPKATLS